MSAVPFRGTKAVFFDRDGVLNEAIVRDGKPFPPACPEDLVITPGAAEGLTALTAGGYLLIGVTNQPDVARGIQSRDAVEAMNNSILDALPVREILVCYHDDEDSCECRKPRPGLLMKAAERYQIDLTASFLVGDRWRDIEAGHQAGCRTILIDYGYAEAYRGRSPHYRVHSLRGAIRVILGQAVEGETTHD